MTERPREGSRTVVLGLLGGIASGKSTVGRLLAGPRGVVIDADALAHEILDAPELVRRIRERFGDEVIGADGRPDREALARLVFAPGTGKAALAELQDWIHPRVRARILVLLSEARTAGVPRIVLDVPLLLEREGEDQGGLVAQCDALVFVDSDDGEREERARRTRGWGPGEVALRESWQLPLEEKRRRADHVIQNNGTLEELERNVAEVLSRIPNDD